MGLNILTAIVLFYLGSFIPIAGFVFPVFLIRKSLENEIRKNIIFHLVVYFTIIVTSLSMEEDKILLMIFLSIYAIIELLYFFLRRKYVFGTFDKIIISTIIGTIIVTIQYFINIDIFRQFYKILKEVYSVHLNMTDKMITEYFQLFFDKSLYILFVYIFIITTFSYFLLDRKNFKNWEISYIYLIMYIIPVLGIDVFKIKNFYMENIAEILKFVYIVYGIKVFYFFLRKKIKYNFAANLIVVLLTIMYPPITFVIGAIKSFNLKLSLGKSY